MKVEKVIIPDSSECPFYRYEYDDNGPERYECLIKDGAIGYGDCNDDCPLKKKDYLIHLKQKRNKKGE